MSKGGSKEEAKIQAECYKWFNNTYCLKHHTPRLLMFSIPNELAGRNKIATIQARSMGLTAGVADTQILLPNGKSIFVEFKTSKGTQSDNQKDFEVIVTPLGFDYYIIRSVGEFKALIKSLQHYIH